MNTTTTDHFCTLFYSNYLSRGMAMQRSLMRECPTAILYVLAMDASCRDVLAALAPERTEILSFDDIASEALRQAVSDRSLGETAWTAKPFLLWYLLEVRGLPRVTYVEADAFFFNDPHILLEEMGPDCSFLITEHAYTPRFDQTLVSGRFCAQWITAENNCSGVEISLWWRDRCMEWCYAVPENGRLGDQKYLEDIHRDREEAGIMQHRGGGVGPWNVQRYRFFSRDGRVFGRLPFSLKGFPLVFYHFHGLLFMPGGKVYLSDYPLSRAVVRWIYKPYIQALASAAKDIHAIAPGLDPHGIRTVERARSTVVRKEDAVKIRKFLVEMGIFAFGSRAVRALRRRMRHWFDSFSAGRVIDLKTNDYDR